jgi:hypothetical protein
VDHRVDGDRRGQGGDVVAVGPDVDAVVLVLLPLTTDLPLDAKVGTAAVYLAVGVAIGSLLPAVARGPVRPGAYRRM